MGTEPLASSSPTAMSFSVHLTSLDGPESFLINRESCSNTELCLESKLGGEVKARTVDLSVAH